MNKKRTLLFRGIAILLLIAIAAVMLVIGRGHTVYFDNKAQTETGESFEAPYKVEVYVDDERVAKLYEDERGMATNIGQDFKMVLEITPEKGADPYTVSVGLKLPYNMDGAILNLPALLAGQPASVYQSEFIQTIPEEEEEETGEDDMGNIDMGEF